MKEIERNSEKSIQKNKWYCVYRITNLINGKTYIGQHKYTNETNPIEGYKGSGLILWKACQKISESNRKVEHTAEWNAKVAKSTKAFYQSGKHNSSYGVKHSESHCKRISESRKGYKWFNNGIEEVQAKECPEGYVPGFKPGHFKNRIPWNKGKKGVQAAWNKGLHKEKGDDE